MAMGSNEGINAIPFENQIFYPRTFLLKYLDHSANNLNVSGDFSLYDFCIKCLSNSFSNMHGLILLEIVSVYYYTFT